jgi:sugar phosphate isomerase/epimerase
MKIRYTCTHWGSESLEPNEFIDKVTDAGYDGVEINLDGNFTGNVLAAINAARTKNPSFIFIGQNLTSPDNDTFDDYISRIIKGLRKLSDHQPDFINSHTGRDYFSFDQNCRIIEAMLSLSAQTGVKIIHETHRGRFSFHTATLLPYLQKFPELELAGDFSHFCTVSESLLADQEETLQKIMQHVSHIHARIGFEHSPQVNDPTAPEWEGHLNRFMEWWQAIVAVKKEKGWSEFTITPEFGPDPYMPKQPFTQMPLSDQWNDNIFMMDQLKKAL